MLDLNNLYKGDCLELMKDIDDKSIDMILCDLPYGVTQNVKDKQISFDKLWENYKRIIKPNGAIVLTAQQPFVTDLINSCRDWFKYDIIWDKIIITGFLNANKMPLRSHEHVLVFYDKQPTYNPQKTIGKATHGGSAKTNVNRNYGDFTRPKESNTSNVKFPVSIIKYSKPHPSIARHPTEKSLKLFEYLIKTYTEPGEIVFDNCLGCGTSLEASMNTNRIGLGCEWDNQYKDTIRNRCMFDNSKLEQFGGDF